MSKTPRLKEAIYHLEQHVEDMEKWNVMYDEISKRPDVYAPATCRVCGNDPKAILVILKDILAEVSDD